MSKSPPAPTPPKETSSAATGTNVSTAIANSYLNNMNEYTPDGTRTFDKTGSESITDPFTNQTYEIPRFSVTQTYSPEQQAIRDESQGAQFNMAQLANNQSGFLNDYMADPFSYNSGEHEAWSGNLYDKLNGSANARNDEDLRSRLANQGIKAGSDAYDREMRNLETAQGDNRSRFMLDSFNTGFGQAQATRNQPINEITALLSGSQVSQPNFATNPQASNIPTTDNAAIIGNYDNARYQQWAAKQAALGSALGGFGGLFSGIGALQ